MLSASFLHPLTVSGAFANEDGDESANELAEHDIESILVYGRRAELIGESISASSGVIGKEDIEQRVTLRAGEILEFVPGMVVTQHSGSGKANQYFLRGFNLDHGTDFSTSIDGLPINQRTHGHGQGYTDLNFIIPEFIERIDYQKGPYQAGDGDFSTAGSARFKLLDHAVDPFVSIEIGEFGYARAAFGNNFDTGRGHLLVGGEAQTFDGPWTNVEEDVEKFNALIKYTEQRDDSRFAVTFLAYDNQWNSADQIPLRAVEDGRIDRFATVDPTVGGDSSRYSLSFDWTSQAWASTFYVIQSELDLFSNFTYFLNDPVNGDQFEQVDDRITYGGDISHRSSIELGGKTVNINTGLQVRVDDIDEVGLHRTQARRRLSTIRDDKVDEYSAGLFVEGQFDINEDLTANLAVRYDYLGADVESNIAANSGNDNDGLVSVKGGLSYRINESAETYVNVGQSFHSNDARGATASIDPVSGDAIDPVDLLVRGEGAEVGIRLQDNESYNVSFALWVLELDSELLFVGDEGTTEASRASRRYGAELSAYYWLGEQFSADLEVAWTRSRFTEDADGEGNYVDNSLPFVLSAGINYKPIEPVNVNLRLRHFGRRFLESFGEVRGQSFSVLNLGMSYDYQNWQFGVDVLNLLNSNDRDIEYFFESRLAGEPEEGIADIHFHPIQPRSLRFKATYRF
ncbi:TonB-dependent receptor [Alteromonadaceae bacterium M269]|nr:TonB-dependent receptor [Alteromonadaceae bacterium M269]